LKLIDEGGRVVGERVEFARSMGARALGLIGRRDLERSSCLVLEPARQIHTFGMRFPIDVAFCDREGVVVHLVRDLRPWRMTKWVSSARVAVEAPAGGLSGVRLGDRLTVEED
jgi:uncharacterized protein